MEGLQGFGWGIVLASVVWTSLLLVTMAKAYRDGRVAGQRAQLKKMAAAPPGGYLTPWPCPTCGSSQFERGPRGGLAQNVRCHRGHEWNMTPFGLELLPPSELPPQETDVV